MQMILGPHVGQMTAQDLAAAYPWPVARAWVRAMMVLSLDGASTGADGLSGSISSPGDKRVFLETRRLCDAVVVGAGTIRAEHYKPFLADPAAADERGFLGLDVAPRLVIVSASLHLPWSDPVFEESALRPLVVTVETCDGAELANARRHAEVVVLPGSRVDPVALVDCLNRRDLLRIVCEGGPNLLAEFVHAKCVDEADISVAPLIVGGGQTVTGTPMFELQRFRLVHSIVDDSFLFNRYVLPED